MNLNGVALNTNHIWIINNEIQNPTIIKTQRVGIDYAQADALLPWRYILKD